MRDLRVSTSRPSMWRNQRHLSICLISVWTHQLKRRFALKKNIYPVDWHDIFCSSSIWPLAEIVSPHIKFSGFQGKIDLSEIEIMNLKSWSPQEQSQRITSLWKTGHRQKISTWQLAHSLLHVPTNEADYFLCLLQWRSGGLQIAPLMRKTESLLTHATPLVRKWDVMFHFFSPSYISSSTY